MSIIIGIDPGSRIAGFGVLELAEDFRFLEAGVIDVRSSGELPQRLAELSQQIAALFLKWRPDAVSLEKVFLGKNPDSAFVLGHARGVCLAHAAESGAQVAEYATRAVKKAVGGRGSSSKEELQRVIEMQFGRKVPQLDATDALALALCHGRQVLERRVLEKAQGSPSL